ncbi:mannose-6-phosphate isomerase, class I [Salinactinospora qingdaonensis]|uniref:mannose-6-phosphate isomerase n=1 Tax=Salinactinospora qingdaonensis TaxID=702744 RepID=A0ABP7FY09_9ACTN
MWRLANQVRSYAWGSTTAIPRLLGVEPTGQPQAELWLGAHGSAPSHIVTATGSVALDTAIAECPQEMLGEEVALRFGKRLPFLLKLLAAQEPLSLQAHPSSERAQRGYAAENAAGIALDAPHRNYKDPFHKPELVLALEDFQALCGFRPPAHALAELEGLTSDLAVALRTDLAAPTAEAALRAAMTRLLTLPREHRADAVAALVSELARRTEHCGHSGNVTVALDLAQRYPGDPGAVAALLLNHLTLAPGEALFLPAGNVHAYLSGTAVEVMACSDNVLRAGLTPKHVDAEELLDVVDFAVLPIPYVHAQHETAPGRLDYRPDIADFALSVISPDSTSVPEHSACRLPEGPVIVLALEGAVRLSDATGTTGLTLERGESAFVPASHGRIEVDGQGRVITAAVGQVGAAQM